jgi:hypothetical protein
MNPLDPFDYLEGKPGRDLMFFFLVIAS